MTSPSTVPPLSTSPHPSPPLSLFQPLSEWVPWRQDVGAAPHIVDLRVCQSVAECEKGDDVCIEYYIDAAADAEFYLDVTTDDGGILACEDFGHWVRDISDEEIQHYRDLFFNTGIVSIPNFLKPDVFRDLQRALAEPLHSQFWQASFVNPATGRAQLVPRSRANAARIQSMIDTQHQRREEGKYAYSFTRTMSGIAAKYRRFYRLFFGDMRGMLDSLGLQDMLTRITDRHYEVTVLFISRYKSGDFLDRHSDSVETRRIAFTLHLTEKWRLEYGGLLLFLNQRNWDRAERVLVPQRNAFTFFDVSEERRILPHMVTEVVSGKPVEGKRGGRDRETERHRERDRETEVEREKGEGRVCACVNVCVCVYGCECVCVSE